MIREYVIDTSIVGKMAVRGAVTSSILLFNIDDFGINKKSFLDDLAPTFYNLPYDMYDVSTSIELLIKDKYPSIYETHKKEWVDVWHDSKSKHREIKQFWKKYIQDDDIFNEINLLKPQRKRSCFRYNIHKGKKVFEWIIKEDGVPIFKQNVQDLRSRTRYFSAPSIEVYKNDKILKLIACICQLVSQSPNAFFNSIDIDLHQMITYTNSDKAEPAPEGLHQDGSPFIVSGLVIERQNVKGGESRVYYERNKGALAFSHESKAGEGIFQSDTNHNYWHEISTIYAINKTEESFRSILGFDIQLNK